MTYTFKSLLKELEGTNLGPLKKAEVRAVDSDGNEHLLELKFDSKGLPYFAVEFGSAQQAAPAAEAPTLPPSFYEEMAALCDGEHVIRHVFNRPEVRKFALMQCPSLGIAWVQGPKEYESLCGSLHKGPWENVHTNADVKNIYFTVVDMVCNLIAD